MQRPCFDHPSSCQHLLRYKRLPRYKNHTNTWSVWGAIKQLHKHHHWQSNKSSCREHYAPSIRWPHTAQNWHENALQVTPEVLFPRLRHSCLFIPKRLSHRRPIEVGSNETNERLKCCYTANKILMTTLLYYLQGILCIFWPQRYKMQPTYLHFSPPVCCFHVMTWKLQNRKRKTFWCDVILKILTE